MASASPPAIRHHSSPKMSSLADELGLANSELGGSGESPPRGEPSFVWRAEVTACLVVDWTLGVGNGRWRVSDRVSPWLVVRAM